MAVVAGSNKRKFQRVETHMPVAVEAVSGRLLAHIVNISPDGCQLESPTQVRPSELLTLSFGRQSAPVLFRVKVQWCVPKGKVFQYGTCFWAMDEDAKKDLLKSLIQVASLYKPEKPKEEVKAKEEGKAAEGEKPAQADANADAEGNAVQAATLEEGAPAPAVSATIEAASVVAEKNAPAGEA